MIKVCFTSDDTGYRSFEVSGHAGYNQSGLDIVCAAVSSAVQLTVNAVTEVAGIKADVQVNEDTIILKLPEHCTSQICEILFSALYLHLNLLAKDYKGTIRVIKK